VGGQRERRGRREREREAKIERVFFFPEKVFGFLSTFDAEKLDLFSRFSLSLALSLSLARF